MYVSPEICPLVFEGRHDGDRWQAQKYLYEIQSKTLSNLILYEWCIYVTFLDICIRVYMYICV